MKWLDLNRAQVADFAALQKKISETKGAWAEHRMLVKAKLKCSDDDATRIIQESLGGTDTLRLLDDYSGDADGAIQKIRDKKEEEKRIEEKGRVAVLDYLSTSECTLFKTNCSVSQSALDALFDGNSPAQVLEKVVQLNDEKRTFDTFEELVEAVSGKKVKSRKKPGDNKSFEPVLHYLSSPQCTLFRGANGLRVTSNEIRNLLNAYHTDVQRLLCDVSILNILGVQLQAFSDLASSLKNPEVEKYKNDIFQRIKDPNATHFTKVPEAFPDDDMYGILAVSTSRINFLPEILKNMDPVDSLDDLSDSISETITNMAASEALEQDKVVGFLSKFGIFSKQFPITVPDVQKLIWTSQFSKWGMQGHSVEDILKALHESDCVFDSFEALIKAVSEKADKLGQALARAST